MRLYRLAVMCLAVTAVALATTGPGMAKPIFRKPPPPGVVEMIDVPYGPIIEMKDGSIMMANGDTYRISTDGGLTWGEEQALNCEGLGGVDGLIRLRSGELCMTYSGPQGLSVATSQDEGKTWSEGQPIEKFGGTRGDSLIELESGRLVYPARNCFSNNEHPELLYEDVLCYGSWRGHKVGLEGHYHYPELDIAAVSYSDDLGKTWGMSRHLYGWFDHDGVPNGRAGATACDEPVAAECPDGRVLFMARSTVGRLVYTHSSDGGEHWTAVKPTELASCYSPCRLERIPGTGDLLVVWNQVNSPEIRRGYRRGRLSAAISSDGGASWKNFRTIEVSAGLEDVDRVICEQEIKPVVGLPWVGEIPEDYARFHYPYLDIAAGKVFIRYGRGWYEEVEGEAVGPTELVHEARGASEQVMRIYPLDYFYE